MRVYVPGDYLFSKMECDGAKCYVSHEANNILAVTFRPDKTGDYSFKVRF
jgi:hypothetical protein